MLRMKLNLLIALVMIASLIGSTLLPMEATSTANRPEQTVYLAPGLDSTERETISIIVTAEDSSETAMAAVEALGGAVTSDLWLIKAVAATLPVSQLEELAATPGLVSIGSNRGVRSAQDPVDGWDGWVTDYRFPVPWDGSPDVQETVDSKSYKLVYPVSIDLGTDTLIEGTHPVLAETNETITGFGVTVAVLDSGIYFSDEVKKIFGPFVSRQFLGQADFVGDGICTEIGAGKLKDSIKQETGYCWTDYQMSGDAYGHGTHVAGILWNSLHDNATGVRMGVAPRAKLLGVRVLDADGFGTYEDVIEGIQYVVEKKDTLGIRVLNMSLSAYVTSPYFADPLNRAVEAAWANGIVVVAAAGNEGPGAESITVPGNDPYVITVGGLDGRRTPGYWDDDFLAGWSGSGPTWDGFPKPEVLAPAMNIVSFMHNDHNNMDNSSALVQAHPDYSATTDLFRMNGTSMATAATSGVVALMLEAHSELTPDQVKYRLLVSAWPAVTTGTLEEDLVYNIFQQGAGRLWAPEALFGDLPEEGNGNFGMNILGDLAHGTGWVDLNGDGWVDLEELDPTEMAYHYEGPFSRLISDDGRAYMYYAVDEYGEIVVYGAAWADTMEWIDADTLAGAGLTWIEGQMSWEKGLIWAGGRSWSGGRSWGGGRSWSGGRSWGGSLNPTSLSLASTTWVGDDWGNPDPALEPSPMPTVQATTVSNVDSTNSAIDEPAPPPIPTVEPTQTSTTAPPMEPTATTSPEEMATVEPAAPTAEPPPPSPTPIPPTATATTPAATATLHVANLDGAGQPDNNSWRAYVTITVFDDSQTPVGQATVSGLWNGGDLGGGACVTDSSGQCSLTSDKVNSNQYSDLTFKVDGVVHGNFTYEAADNGDPDGDSDGTTIIVSRPS